MQYYNVHTHTFTMKNAPQNFLQLYLHKPIANDVDSITDVQLGSYMVQQILNRVGGNGGRRYSSFLKIGKSRDQLNVFENLREQYRDDASFRFVGLTMDMEQCGAGKSLSGYPGQLEEILRIKKRYPDNLLLFLGVDPRWKLTGPELCETVQNYFDTKLIVNADRMVNPFVGLKIYPSMGFYPFDPRLKETFEWAALKQVPILSHCNYLGGMYNNDKAYIDGVINSFDPYNQGKAYPSGGVTYVEERKFGRWILGRQKSKNNLHKCSYFMEPTAFETLLKHFEERQTPLKLCLAHFGGGNQIKAAQPGAKPDPEDVNPYGFSRQNWFTTIQQMMVKYPSLYTDISYALHDRRIHDILLREVGNNIYGDRIMFGTDFFLTEREGPELDTYRIFKERAVVTKMKSGTTAWDLVAGSNTEAFLKSSYYDGTVL